MVEFTEYGVQGCVNYIVATLGQPKTPAQEQALTAFNAGDHATVKHLASVNLSCSYCRSLGYLGSALKLTPNTSTILAEAARAAADHERDKALARLGQTIGERIATPEPAPV